VSNQPRTLRFALLGAGFWARYQLAAWRELADVECVAIYNRSRSKADELAKQFGVPRVYDDLQKLFDAEKLDFIDIVTDVGSHAPLVRAAAERRLPVICQKPMAGSLAEAESMVAACRGSNTPLFIHENWRWQAPIREVRHILDDGRIGRPFRARIDMISGFPVFQNQPFLQNLEQFIIADLGSHILDVARFLFGEARRLYCQTQRVHVGIRGEDVATVMLTTDRDVNVVCQMAYAENPLEHDCFPQTLLFIEGTRGSIEITSDYWVRLTAENGTFARRYPPTMYAWCDPQYAVVQSSIVACHMNLVLGLRGSSKVETTGDDNLRTMQLVFKSYESAARNEVVTLA
jgi:predicted dehydrogenase